MDTLSYNPSPSIDETIDHQGHTFRLVGWWDGDTPIIEEVHYKSVEITDLLMDLWSIDTGFFEGLLKRSDYALVFPRLEAGPV